MAKIPFDIKFRPQIESGEYKVILDCNVEAEILAWDKPGEYPIVCMAKKEGAIPFRTNNNGKAYHFPEGANYSDLFIVTPEEELTEWQRFISACLQKHGLLDCGAADRIAKESAAELLALAKQQLLQSGELLTKEHHENLMEIQYNKTLEGVKKNWHDYFTPQAVTDIYNTGRNDVLKDLPRWNKCQEDAPSACVYNCAKREDSLLYYNGHTLKLIDLEKLPGFREG